MFAPPPELTADVFTVLPDELKKNGQASEWSFGKANPDMSSFLEGPSIDRNGDLLVTDIPFGRVFRVDSGGRFHLITEFDGEPNGLAIHRDGTLYIADHKNGLMTVDPATGATSNILRRIRREGFKGLNDALFDLDGNLYFNDQGQTGMQDPTGRVYRLRPDGEIDLLVDTVPSPNGMAISPDGRVLYLAVTRANQIWRLPLHPDGTTTKVNIFLQLSGGLTGPDGLAIDADGNLVVCHCGLGAVWVFSPLGVPLYRIHTPTGLDATAACYGGKDNRTLFITESSTGSILTVELPTPGAKMFSHV
ncbi:MAG: SMP-30/gluconolactonase/LRE family protein [Rhodospirillales bacterium]